MSDLKSPPLPLGWVMVEKRQDGEAYINKTIGLTVIISAQIEDDQTWFHVSMSRRSRMPTYEDTKLIKRLFLGTKTHAYQVFPPDDENINIHPYCLHLWSLVGGKPALPDFTRGGLGL